MPRVNRIQEPAPRPLSHTRRKPLADLLDPSEPADLLKAERDQVEDHGSKGDGYC